MTLDLSAYTRTADSPELAAFKEKVRTVAKKYTSKHGWCGEVDRALKEIGIADEKPVPVIVVTNHPLTFTVRVLPSQLVGLTDADQKRKILETLGDITLGTVKAKASALIPLESVVSLSLRDSGDSAASNDEFWVYGSSEGRVLHRIDPSDEECYADDERRYSSFTFLCRKITAYRSHMTKESSRGTGRRCVECDRRTANI